MNTLSGCYFWSISHVPLEPSYPNPQHHRGNNEVEQMPMWPMSTISSSSSPETNSILSRLTLYPPLSVPSLGYKVSQQFYEKYDHSRQSSQYWKVVLVKKNVSIMGLKYGFNRTWKFILDSFESCSLCLSYWLIDSLWVSIKVIYYVWNPFHRHGSLHFLLSASASRTLWTCTKYGKPSRPDQTCHVRTRFYFKSVEGNPRLYSVYLDLDLRGILDV